jgi:hypothetical protein
MSRQTKWLNRDGNLLVSCSSHCRLFPELLDLSLFQRKAEDSGRYHLEQFDEGRRSTYLYRHISAPLLEPSSNVLTLKSLSLSLQRRFPTGSQSLFSCLNGQDGWRRNLRTRRLEFVLRLFGCESRAVRHDFECEDEKRKTKALDAAEKEILDAMPEKNSHLTVRYETLTVLATVVV